ncbi:MAG: xanthine dehydrogenase family protein molybdopterin-binding subunit [Pseudomonadota bacterium]
MHAPGSGLIGTPHPRLEDPRLLTGRGQYLDDHAPAGCVHAVFVRSEHAHAEILAIDVSPALAATDVLDVLTASDLDALGLGDLWPNARTNPHTGEPFRFEPMPVLARGRVRYVGEPVACVVACSRDAAADAAALVDIDYAPIAAAATMTSALAADAPAICAAAPGNLCMDWFTTAPREDEDAVDRAFAEAAHVVSLDCHNHRIAAQPMECRGALGEFDAQTRRYTLTLASQNVHSMRDHLRGALGQSQPVHGGAPARKSFPDLRVLARDVGGGFGSRNFVYPEYAAVLVAAERLGRPVKWVASRSEACMSDHPARDATLKVSLALTAEGRFLAMRADALFNAGGYMTGVACGVPTGQYMAAPSTVYDIARVALRLRVVLTNTVPIGVTRGPGFAETVDPLERLIDKAARELDIDRLELRRRNFVRTARMPWRNAAGTRIDSGDFQACLDKALAHADVGGFAARAAEARERGRLRGYGVACHIKGTGGSPEENVHFGFDFNEGAGERSERLVFTTGTQAIGQGHETSFRQIVATLFGVPMSAVAYRAGDTALIPFGGGHGSSRATFMASQAMVYAAKAVIAKGRRVAADLFEASPGDVRFESGEFYVDGTDLRAGLFDVAREARALGSSLDTYQHTIRDELTWPNGCHVAEVEVDVETGQVELLRYTTADDHGVMVNPMLVSGQAHGAIMQGAAQALLEQVQYAPDGQLLTGSFLDYAMPRAADLPPLDLHFCPTRCTTNPLGVKGAGEPGAIAGFPAVQNAIAHALDVSPDALRGAATPNRVWALMQRSAVPSVDTGT